MVEVKFDKKNPYKVYIVRNWRDHIDQIRISSIFTIGLLIVAIYQNIVHDNTRIYYYIWPLISLILLIYCLFPTSRTTFDLENNFWKIQNYAILPIKKFEGTISSLSKLISTESIDERRKSKFSLKKSKLYFDLSIIELNAKGESKKKIFFSIKTYSYQSHKYNVRQNEKIGLVLENFFQNLNISIEFEKEFHHFTKAKI